MDDSRGGHHPYDAIVIGAGIIGLSIGWKTAQLGLSVLVLDRNEKPRGASWVAAGMLAPVTEANFGEDALLRLNIESAHRWPGFATELAEISGMDLLNNHPGTLHVAVDRDQAEALRRLYEYQIQLGLDVEWLGPAELRGLEPALHPGVRSGVRARGDSAVDPRKVLQALAEAFRAAGGDLRLGEDVVEIDVREGPMVILAGGGSFAAGIIVVAAGCWSPSIKGMPEGLGKAVRPVKGQILRLRPRSSGPLIRHTIRTEEVYLVPRPGGETVVGATVEELGFDSAPTAGAVLELLQAADEVVPGIREMELAEVSVGLRPGSPDNAPLIGSTSVPGVVLATGHYRNGILLAPVTADAIAHLIAKGEAPSHMSDFQPSRFKDLA
jgi:glycine oxidase